MRVSLRFLPLANGSLTDQTGTPADSSFVTSRNARGRRDYITPTEGSDAEDQTKKNSDRVSITPTAGKLLGVGNLILIN